MIKKEHDHFFHYQKRGFHIRDLIYFSAVRHAKPIPGRPQFGMWRRNLHIYILFDFAQYQLSIES